MLRPQSALPEKQNQSAELEQEMEESGAGVRAGEEGQEAEGGTLGSRGDRLTGPRELSNPSPGRGGSAMCRATREFRTQSWLQKLRRCSQKQRSGVFLRWSPESESSDCPLCSLSDLRIPRALTRLTPPSDHTPEPHSPISTPSWFRILQSARQKSSRLKIEMIDEIKNFIKA